MKQLILPALFGAFLLSSACSKAPAPEAPAPEAAAPAGPQVGDKIGDSDAEKAAAKEASIAAAAAEALRKEEEIKARGVTVIGWEDLMPEGEEERLQEMYAAQMAAMYSIAEGSAGDAPVQIGSFNTVDTHDGDKIRIPGYTVPFSYDAKAEISEFLLVPYYGACIHAPPPPPNQTIFVRIADPIPLRQLPQAVWVEGTLHAQRQDSDLADAAYIIDMTYLEKYQY
ncbi:MAG: DUF3299 domain-containing protein [Hyphomonas sp.]